MLGLWRITGNSNDEQILTILMHWLDFQPVESRLASEVIYHMLKMLKMNLL